MILKINVFFRLKLFSSICSLFLLFTTANTKDYKVIINSGEKSFWLKVVNEDGLDFFSIREFARLSDLRHFYNEKTKKSILYLDAQEVKFTALNPFVLVGEDIHQLPADTRYLNSDIYIPLKFFVGLAEKFQSIKIHHNTKRRQLDIAIERKIYHDYNINGLSFEEKINGTLIRIATTKVFKNADIIARLRYDWVYIDIYGGKVDSLNLVNTTQQGLVSKTIPLQLTENMAQLSFKLKQSISDLKAYINPGKNEILVSLRSNNELAENVLKGLEKERRKWQIDRIMLDPGHGGKDPGAVGQGGVYEKSVVLKIALHLRKLLEKNLNVKVFMTRDDDTFIPLAERTAMANRLGAKLFISIHANANLSRRVNGTSTYILGPAKTPEAIEVARRENSAIRLEDSQERYRNLDSEQFILSSIAQSEFTRESEELAALVQTEVYQKTKIKNRGVKQAGYYVLIGASMPSILFETAFISNKKEEKLLNSDKFQKKVAEALYQSIKKFKSKYEQRQPASEYGQNLE